MPRYALVLLARFAVVYGLLVWLCASVPVYASIESAVTRIAAAALRERAMESRSLSLERRGDEPVYVYELRVGAVSRTLERSYHKHAFVLVLFLALVLATPGLRPRDLSLALVVGGGLVFTLCVAMLMSDVEIWESGALADAGLAPTRGPYPLSLGFVEGLHRTAAAGLLPILLWAIVMGSRGGVRARRPRATSPE